MDPGEVLFLALSTCAFPRLWLYAQQTIRRQRANSGHPASRSHRGRSSSWPIARRRLMICRLAIVALIASKRAALKQSAGSNQITAHGLLCSGGFGQSNAL